ncbi:hypothetical protein RJ640_029758 [Escallonia rubra]|uniref:RRM domain-containing protein n=1 Tax=Escallonia rubra TaxID=112253 RepID=A0AA88QWL2_9ASTE|nr:hypothetical protein RJ640_029758 [Escallonia rubra]
MTSQADGSPISSASCKSRTSSGFAIQQNVLFRRICLGILIGYSNYVSEEGCELLLHYAATGTILDSPNTQNPGLKHRNRNSNWQEDSITSNKNYSRKEAMVGACLVFDFVDVTESMSSTLFESEECAVDFICRGFKDLDDAIDALKSVEHDVLAVGKNADGPRRQGHDRIKSLRLPMRFGNHRGFGFVEYVTKQEAQNALEALSSTHFYGRHLHYPLMLVHNGSEAEYGNSSKREDKRTKLRTSSIFTEKERGQEATAHSLSTKQRAQYKILRNNFEYKTGQFAV